MPAAEDLERICERIELEDPEAARRVARRIYPKRIYPKRIYPKRIYPKRIYQGCARLNDFPHLGRTSIRMPGRRELVFAPLPYIAVYEIRGGAIEISRILHGAQDWS